MTMPTPSYGSARKVKIYGQSSSMDSGSVLRRSSNGRAFVEYDLVYKPGQLDATTAAALLSEFDNAKGPAGTFTMTAWDSASSGTYRFLDDSLNLDVASIVAYGCTIPVVRVSL